MKTHFTTITLAAMAIAICHAEEKPGRGKDGPNPAEIFKRLDSDGDGSVSLAEFKAAPKAKEHPEKAEEIFKKIDSNGDGSLSKEEFASHRPHPPRGDGEHGGDRPRPSPAEIVKKLDTDGDGSVSLAEFKASPKAKEHPEMAEEIFKKIDSNGDGALTVEEFAAHHPHPPGGMQKHPKNEGGEDADNGGGNGENSSNPAE